MDSQKQQSFTILGISLLLLSMFSPFSQAHAASLQTFNIEYQVIRNDDDLGSSKRQLHKSTDTTWIMTAITTPEGFITLFFDSIIQETSQISVVNQQVKPTQYVYLQSDEEEIEKHDTLKFNWSANEFSRNGAVAKEPLPSNTQDILSFTLQIMLDLANNKEEMTYTIADRKRISKYTLQVKNNNEILDTDNGKFVTTKLETTAESRYKFIIWCANEYAYLPIKIMKVEPDGDVIELIVKNYSIN